MGILLFEHHEVPFEFDEFTNQSSLIAPRKFLSKRNERNCYHSRVVANTLFMKADYYIGVDWVIKGSQFIQVKPKLNTKVLERFEQEIEKVELTSLTSERDQYSEGYIRNTEFLEVNYLKLLMDAFQNSEIASETDDLVLIDWQADQIEIDQKDDTLTPFLVVQFLNILKHISKKGLKQAYYKVQEDLVSRVKGRILVGDTIRKNVLRNRLTKTYCEYQKFGLDHHENRFLKKVLCFCSNYIHQNEAFFGDERIALERLVAYCKSTFSAVSDDIQTDTLKNIRNNPFFKEYKIAIRIGGYILKRFAYNISNTAISNIKTPPFWIDMPRLFELYVYQKLLMANPTHTSKIRYQFSTYGNELDILINNGAESIVIDAKYKLQYQNAQVHEDMRQVAGYARLNKVLKEVGFKTPSGELTVTDPTLNCLIIYPDMASGLDLQNIDDLSEFSIDRLISDRRKVGPYHKIYKFGVKLPLID